MKLITLEGMIAGLCLDEDTARVIRRIGTMGRPDATHEGGPAWTEEAFYVEALSRVPPGDKDYAMSVMDFALGLAQEAGGVVDAE